MVSGAGYVKAVCLSREKGVAKKAQDEGGLLIAGHGLKGDAHAGPWHRQVSLLAQESVAKIMAKGLKLSPGDFGENLTTEGIELTTLPIGTRLRVGQEALLEVTQIGRSVTMAVPSISKWEIASCRVRAYLPRCLSAGK